MWAGVAIMGTVRISAVDGIMVCAPAGALDPVLAAAVQRALLAGLAEHPPVIICDLSGVTWMDPVCAGVFTVLRHPALDAGGTTLLLCGVRPVVQRVLVARGAPRHVTVLDDLDSALAMAHLSRRRLGERLTLEPTATAPGVARDFIRDVCDRWGLSALAGPVALAAFSLVAGAVTAAGARMELRLRVNEGGLRLDLHDQDADVVPVLVRGDGLELVRVRQAASTWGVRREPAGGKSVWCAFDLPAGSV
jgi:anti-anti-sigma factor